VVQSLLLLLGGCRSAHVRAGGGGHAPTGGLTTGFFLLRACARLDSLSPGMMSEDGTPPTKEVAPHMSGPLAAVSRDAARASLPALDGARPAAPWPPSRPRTHCISTRRKQDRNGADFS
jgi:hypothetical protein